MNLYGETTYQVIDLLKFSMNFGDEIQQKHQKQNPLERYLASTMKEELDIS